MLVHPAGHRTGEEALGSRTVSRLQVPAVALPAPPLPWPPTPRQPRSYHSLVCRCQARRELSPPRGLTTGASRPPTSFLLDPRSEYQLLTLAFGSHDLLLTQLDFGLAEPAGPVRDDAAFLFAPSTELSPQPWK